MIGDVHHAPLESIIVQQTFRPFEREDLQRYAQASGDSNPLHLDRDFARQAGFPDVIAQGMLGMALLGRLLEENLSHHRLLTFRATFRKVIEINRPIQGRARLSNRVANEVDLAVELLDADGAVLIEGMARLALVRIAGR